MEVIIQSENSTRKSTNITMATSVLSRKKGVIVGDDVLKVRLSRDVSPKHKDNLDAIRGPMC